MNKYIIIKTTCSKEEEAFKITNILLDKKLISCGQITSVDSYYFWQGKKEHQKEYKIEMKTKKELYKEVEKEIKKIHSYEVPEIVAYDIQYASKEFIDWIDNETINEIKLI